MSKLIVTKDFDYRWPSGSLTALIADAEPVTVKREITDYAIAHGYGKDAEAKATGGVVPKPDKPLVVGEKGPELTIQPDKANDK